MVVIIITFFLFAGNRESSREPSVLKEDKDIQVTLEDKREKTDHESSPIFVEVKGAVKSQVYTFQSDARVEEAIRRAGALLVKQTRLKSIKQQN